jgi:hypothetical protein
MNAFFSTLLAFIVMLTNRSIVVFSKFETQCPGR